MTNDLIDRFNLFIEQVNVDEINTVWSMQSSKFRDFWKNKIMDNSYSPLSDSDIDEIILILDKKARGSTKETCAVANTMIPQGVWGILFNQIKESNPLKDHLNRLFHSENEEEKINLINEIYKINEGKKNSLTGRSGNAINCLLFADSPSTYLAIISLNDRQRIIKHYEINSSLDFEKDSPGRKIIVSNNEILDWFRNNKRVGSPMLLTRFAY